MISPQKRHLSRVFRLLLVTSVISQQNSSQLSASIKEPCVPQGSPEYTNIKLGRKDVSFIIQRTII